MNQNSKITLSAVCATFLLSNANANNTPANEIANNVVRLDKAKEVVRLDKAKEKNPTIDGTGIVVGILDGPFNLKNPIIKDQAYTDPINNKIEPNYFSGLNNASDMRHGTNVTSIIVGDGKNYTQKEAGSEKQVSLKGVAYKSKFYGIAYNNPGATYNSNNLESDIQKLADAGVKVINFSAVNHNKLGFALLNRKIDDGVEYMDNTRESYLSQQEYQKMLKRASWDYSTKTYGLKDFATIQQSVQKNGMLLVTGSGNDGFVAPRTSSSMAAYDESYRELLVVGGLNSAEITIEDGKNKKWKVTGITQNKVQSIVDKYKTGSTSNGTSVSISTTKDGKKDFAKRVVDQVVAQQGIYYASNLFKGTSLYSIVAPAQNVAVANGAYQYVSKETERDQIITQNSGTSFATPYASGVAALVQQKYSFLTGAQLADVLLSTANSDVELPDMLVLSSNNGTAYTVVYVDKQNNNDVPKKEEDGSIGTEQQVKKDLMEKLDLKYNKANNLNEGDLADYIVENLLKSKKDSATNSDFKLDKYAVVKLSKEEIIGQGILDANKALNGLARLDINRMNKEDIQSYTTIKEHSGTELNNNQTETKTYGFYTIDTKGYDGTNAFTNDIEERKWDDKYHLDVAINSLKSDNRISDLKTLEAGFVKTGQGTFKFEGNTLKYNGPTLVRGGTLRLDNVTAENTALYADKGGRIEITGNSNNAKRQLYAINGGEVQISGTLSSGDVYALNGGIVGGKGTITKNLQNDSGVVFAGFMPDTDSINGGEKLSVDGKYTQGNKGRLIIGFNKNSSNSVVHTDLSATNYDIKGGVLEILPVYDENGQRIQSGDKLQLNLAFLKNNANLKNNVNFENIEVADTRTLRITFDKNTQIISAELKADVLKTQNMSQSMSSAINTIYNDTQGKEEYDRFFKRLDFVDEQTFTQTLDSIAESTALSSVSDELNAQQSNNFASLGYILTPMNSTRSNRGIRLSAAGDLRNVLAGLFGRPNRQQMIVNTSYSKMKHTAYTASALSTNLQYKNRVYDNLILGVFADYTIGNASHTYANRSDSTYTLGASAIYNLGYFSLLGSVSVGVGSNTATRSILGTDMSSKIEAKYTTTTYFGQLGISKDIALGRLLVLKPMVLANINGISQGGYEERGGLFALRSEAQTYNVPGAALGAHAIYTLPIGTSELNLSIFGFYTMRFLDSIQSRASFKDFSNSQHFIQTASLSISSVYAGLNAQWQYGNYFARLGGSMESARMYTLLNGMLSVGLYF